MSAGGLSYSALTNYGKVTLPSVEMGLGSMNVLRDPPKSITTRRIDKVGQTSSLLDLVDESDDRSCEYITKYPRGINPMVGVSYGGDGTNNGGQYSGQIVPTINRTAYPPYSLGVNGFNFRPPVLRKEQLTPLSRQPRPWTYNFTSKDFPDFSKKLRCVQPNNKSKEIKKESLKVNIRPTSVYRIEKPLKEPFEVKYVIKNPIKVNANSGYRTQEIINNSETNTKQYIQNSLHVIIESNKSHNISTTPINQIMDLDVNLYIKDLKNIEYHTPKTFSKTEKYIHDDIQLNRTLPYYIATTNKNQPEVYKNPILNNDITLSRNIPLSNFSTNIGTVNRQTENSIRNDVEYHLPPKINPGGYLNDGFKPSTIRIKEELPLIDSKKLSMQKKAFAEFENRYQ